MRSVLTFLFSEYPKKMKRASSPVQKKVSKAKYLCKFNEKWTKDFQFIQKSEISDHYVFCTFCKTDFSIGAGGKNDISRHGKGKKHQEIDKALKNAHKISEFVPVGEKEIDKVRISSIIS